MSALTSVGLDAPYPFQVSNTPLINNGTITLSFDPASPLLPANGGTGLTAVGTNGQFLVSNGSAMVWATVPPGGVSNVTASVPLLSSGGANPNISMQTTGSGLVVLDNNGILVAPTVNTSCTLTGPLNGSIPGASATPGIYCGFDTGGDARIQLNSPTRYSLIDFGRPSVGLDWRIIHDDVPDTLTIQSTTQNILFLSNASSIFDSTNIELRGSTLIQGTLASSIVATDVNNKISSIPVSGGTGAIVRDNGATIFNTTLQNPILTNPSLALVSTSYTPVLVALGGLSGFSVNYSSQVGKYISLGGFCILQISLIGQWDALATGSAVGFTYPNGIVPTSFFSQPLMSTSFMFPNDVEITGNRPFFVVENFDNFTCTLRRGLPFLGNVGERTYTTQVDYGAALFVPGPHSFKFEFTVMFMT